LKIEYKPEDNLQEKPLASFRFMQKYLTNTKLQIFKVRTDRSSDFT